MFYILILCGLAIILYCSYKYLVPADDKHIGPMTLEEFDRKWPSFTVKLPHGNTRYYLLGPEDGAKLLFVHGVTSPTPALGEFATILASKGFRVLCFDLYGRGYSDSPGVPYNDALYNSQILSLLQKLGWKKTHLVGYSLGGGIATSFASHFPELIDKLCLICPAGLFKDLGPLATLIKLPVVGKLLMHLLARTLLVRLSGNSSSGTFDTKESVEIANRLNKLHIENHPGLIRAYLSTVKHFPLTNLHKEFEIVGRDINEILLLWGEADHLVTIDCANTAKSLMPKAKLVTKPGIGHALPIEYPKFVSNEIANFMLN